ncbi:MAG: NAD-binding protein [Verrucomicrobia bacterium]|nr:NAD-binding protein [Verrucomicrobiota bacterium]
MSRKLREKIGVIGLGTIGSRVAAGLRTAGYQVYVWSRSPHPLPNFVGSAVEVADLCDVIQLFVSDDAALLEVARTLAVALGPQHLVLAHPTVLPGTAREAARIVGSQGARYLDAPFTGSKIAAGSAGLVYYIAGPEMVQRDARPILEVSSKKIVSIGAEIGQAAVVKLATNMMAALAVQGLAEALALTRANGIDPARFAEALENNGARSGTSDNKLPLMLAGNYEPHFALKHLLKDLRHALQLGSEHQLSTPATATTGALVACAVARGWGGLDFSALAKNYEAVLKAAPAASATMPAPGATVSRPPVTVSHGTAAVSTHGEPGKASNGTTVLAAPAPAAPAAAAAQSTSPDHAIATSTPNNASPPRRDETAAVPPADQRSNAPPSSARTAAPAAATEAAVPLASAAAGISQDAADPATTPRKTRNILRSIFGLENKGEPR